MNPRRIIFILVALVVLALIGVSIYALVASRGILPVLPANAPGTTLPGNGPITIVLAPDFGDAVFSLGGLLAQHTRPAIVATFFTGEPATATSTSFDQLSNFTNSTIAGNVRTAENSRALSALGAVAENYGYVGSQYGQPIASDVLESDIAQDIQALLVANTGRQVYVYGPADFGETTPTDTELLYNAFTDAVNGFPAQNAHFFYYEIYPAEAAWETSATTTLQTFLENESGLFLTTKNILLSSGQVNAKISALKQYQSLVEAAAKSGTDIVTNDRQFTNTRCAGQACEVVYQISQN